MKKTGFELCRYACFCMLGHLNVYHLHASLLQKVVMLFLYHGGWQCSNSQEISESMHGLSKALIITNEIFRSCHFYRNQLEALCKKSHTIKIAVTAMKCINCGTCCTIRMYSETGDVSALWNNLRNGPCHCFKMGLIKAVTHTLLTYKLKLASNLHSYVTSHNSQNLPHTDFLPLTT